MNLDFRTAKDSIALINFDKKELLKIQLIKKVQNHMSIVDSRFIH